MESLVLRGQTKSYVKVAQNGNLRSQVFCPECAAPLFATGVFHAEGQAWRNQRRMVMSRFSPANIRGDYPSLLRVTQLPVDREFDRSVVASMELADFDSEPVDAAIRFGHGHWPGWEVLLLGACPRTASKT